MPIYFVRLEIPDAGPYELKLLNAHLATNRFYRYFLSKNKSFWQLPTGLYRVQEESLAAVSLKLTKALAQINKSGEYVIIESTQMTTKGLRPITRAQAVLLNKGE